MRREPPQWDSEMLCAKLEYLAELGRLTSRATAADHLTQICKGIVERMVQELLTKAEGKSEHRSPDTNAHGVLGVIPIGQQG